MIASHRPLLVFAAPAALASALSGCSVEPVVRQVMLMPDGHLPAGSVTLTADSLLIELDEVEPLALGHHHVAWGSTDEAFVPFGELDHGGVTIVALADLAVPVDELEAVVVTIEESEDADAESPSGAVALHAEIPGVLGIEGVEAEAVAAAMAEASLSGNTVAVQAMGLPALPAPFGYGVWLHFPGAEPAPEEGHAHEMSEGHAEAAPPANEELVRVGLLDPMGALEVTTARTLALARGVSITVEADEGSPAMSPTSILSGEVTLPESGAAIDENAHQH